MERCGGACFVPPHSCNAVKTSVKKVPVMLVMAKWPHGEHEVVCKEVEVEVHDECECGCKLKHRDCHPTLQYYHLAGGELLQQMSKALFYFADVSVAM